VRVTFLLDNVWTLRICSGKWLLNRGKELANSNERPDDLRTRLEQIDLIADQVRNGQQATITYVATEPLMELAHGGKCGASPRTRSSEGQA
jgi:hypothetical protein